MYYSLLYCVNQLDAAILVAKCEVTRCLNSLFCESLLQAPTKLLQFPLFLEVLKETKTNAFTKF